MISRVAASLAKPSGFQASARVAAHARSMSQKATGGSRGRAMPVLPSRATAPVSNLNATFTIRVCLVDRQLYESRWEAILTDFE